MLFLNDEFSKNWQGDNPFTLVQSIEGEVYRKVKSRRTLKFSLNGESYFLKLHMGIGWKEILKDLLQFRLPVTSAENEWNAINRLRELGIDTMSVAAYGKKGINPATIKSFLVTEDLSNTVSLEEYCSKWAEKRPPYPIKMKLIEKIASISRKMHADGICHRDFYICHFLLHNRNDNVSIDNDLRLSLIDLHRALIKNNLGNRWVVKDIAGLYFSCMDLGLTQRDLFRFMRSYKNKRLRLTLEQDIDFWNQVSIKANSLYGKLNRL